MINIAIYLKYVINHFGGEKAFIDKVRRDKEKDEYCYVNNIHLLRIPYTEKNIDLFLDVNLFNY